MRTSHALSLVFVSLCAALAGCSASYDTCGGSPPSGARCSFVGSCNTHSDFWMGYCGDEWRSCVDGRVVYRDLRRPCSLDAGIDAAFDAGGDAGRDSGVVFDCSDYTPPPAATTIDCRAHAECTAGGGCWAPGDTTPFYASGACPRECTGDADCGTGVCRPLNGGVCSQCVPSCASGSCNLWEACGADGHCTPARCEDGEYVCPPGASCIGSATGSDRHGCSGVPCSSDAECGCGACVNGFCASGPGRCDLPRP